LSHEKYIICINNFDSFYFFLLENIEFICPFDQEDAFQIHPIQYAIHTHHLGVFVEGYKVSRDRNNQTNFIWNLIGDGDPQSIKDRPVPVKNQMVIENGDFIAVRCTMNNNLTHPVVIGGLNGGDEDEMCHFYLFFSVGLEDSLLEMDACAVTSKRGWLDEFNSIP
jgi:Copper type II ascorbate-dependent monooxygenase, C-terminal domain